MQDHVREKYKDKISLMTDPELFTELNDVLATIHDKDFREDAIVYLTCLNLEFTKRNKSADWLRIYNEHINTLKQS